MFGPYPFNALGGYVPNVTSGFALETQTRPFYSPKQFANGANVSVVVHELAHQWYGNSVSVDGWKEIWINEASPATASGSGRRRRARAPRRNWRTTSTPSTRPTTRSGR